MIKNIFKKSLFFLIFLFVVYLLLPGPAEPPPLPNSFKSTEPGDTIEIPGLFAYYTNFSRGEAIAFYQKNFSSSKLFGAPLLTYRLNHPPEYAGVVIRDTIHSSFFEELVHPFRESWYINGYEPTNDPFNKTGQKLASYQFEGKEYTAKVTVYKKGSNPIVRVIIFAAVLGCFWWLAGITKALYENFRRNRQL
jgi:hypothetical protein